MHRLKLSAQPNKHTHTHTQKKYRNWSNSAILFDFFISFLNWLSPAGAYAHSALITRTTAKHTDSPHQFLPPSLVCPRVHAVVCSCTGRPASVHLSATLHWKQTEQAMRFRHSFLFSIQPIQMVSPEISICVGVRVSVQLNLCCLIIIDSSYKAPFSNPSEAHCGKL